MLHYGVHVTYGISRAYRLESVSNDDYVEYVEIRTRRT